MFSRYRHFTRQIIFGFIKLYQRSWVFRTPILRTLFLSDSSCRFTPSCSRYSYQAIEKHGIIRGSFLGIKRIIRCHPWSKGGKDPLI